MIAAAKEMKERLEDLGLVTFAKTTGGKGLHVVTPFDAGKSIGWPEAKAIAREICAVFAAAMAAARTSKKSLVSR